MEKIIFKTKYIYDTEKDLDRFFQVWDPSGFFPMNGMCCGSVGKIKIRSTSFSAFAWGWASWLILSIPINIFLFLSVIRNDTVFIPSSNFPNKWHGITSLAHHLFAVKFDPMYRWWRLIATTIAKDKSARIREIPIFLLHFMWTPIFQKSYYLPHLSRSDLWKWREGVYFYTQEILPNCFSFSSVGWGTMIHGQNQSEFRDLGKLSIDDVRQNTKYQINNSEALAGDDRSVVLLAQMPSDKSIKQSCIENYSEVLENFAALAKHLDLHPKAKLHPLLSGKPAKRMVDDLSRLGIETVEGGIKEVLRSYNTFATVSSGSGVECLCEGKPIYILGRPSYRDCGNQVVFDDGKIEIIPPSMEVNDFLSQYYLVDKAMEQA